MTKLARAVWEALKEFDRDTAETVGYLAHMVRAAMFISVVLALGYVALSAIMFLIDPSLSDGGPVELDGTTYTVREQSGTWLFVSLFFLFGCFRAWGPWSTHND